MSKGLDASTTTALAETITQPYFLVYMGFNSPVRLSTVGSISWDGYTWTSAGITVSMSAEPALRIFNESTLFGQVVLTEGTAGRDVTIYYGDKADSAHPNPFMIFSGEMGSATIGEYVNIRCKQFKPTKSPRHYVVPPLCNHVPPSGTRFETPKQVIILERE